MAQAETRNVVVLGAGFAGLSASHYFLRHVYPALKADGKNFTYRLHLVDQSTHFWWHLTAPRTMVKPDLIPHSKTFVPIKDGFEQYPDKDIITFHQASPTNVDLAARTVTLRAVSNDESANGNASETTLPYYALVIATGTNTPTSTTSLHGNHLTSIAALDNMSKRLSTAKTVVLAGGGPIGVETAGEIGELFNGPAKHGWLSSAKPPTNPAVRIILVASEDRLVKVLRPALSEKVAKMLAGVGVEVLFKTRVTKVDETSGTTTVHLDNGSILTADVYIPATGAAPNTSFLPAHILNDKKFVHTNPTTLRVDNAGDRVYALGDVGDYTRGGVLECAAAAPVFGANFARDMGVSSAPSADRKFKGNWGETQIVPVGSKAGAGAFNGWALPSIAIQMMKGKDFFLGEMPKYTEGKGVAKA